MLKFCVYCGHRVEVLLPISGFTDYDFEGVTVKKDTWNYTKQAVKDCDLIISHLDKAGRALNLAEFFKKPFVQVIHNTNFYGILAAKHRDNPGERFAYVVYNSEFTKKEMKYPNPSVIVHPPVDSKRYKVIRKGKKITLINLFERKGSVFFNDLVRMLPEYEFLGVEGGYGKQIKVNAPNITYMENTPEARKIYAQTRILLMPSQYESFGRTGVEAMVSGIPVISAPTPGLKESLGDAGIFLPLDNIQAWVKEIRRLDDKDYYSEVSKKSIIRAKEVESWAKDEMDKMEVFFMNILNKKV
jgi:glycosyltransferase involved in cell wall biosynthesis